MPYAAAKGGVNAITASLAFEYAGHSIRVVGVAPGFTRTEFHSAASINRSFVPGLVWMKADNVARAGLRAVAANRAQCVPGLGYRMLSGISSLTPWSLSRRVLGAVLSP